MSSRDPTSGHEPPRRVSELLDGFLAHTHGPTIRLGDLVALMGDRAFGMLLLVLAIPNVVPVPGVSTAVGIPILILGVQIAAGGQRPWLPRRVADIAFQREAFLAVIGRARPLIARVERRLKPRLGQFTEGWWERGMGALIVILAAVLCLPIFLGNLPPAVAIAIMALGMIEKDGGFVVAGMIAGVLALAFVAGVLLGMGSAAFLLWEQVAG